MQNLHSHDDRYKHIFTLPAKAYKSHLHPPGEGNQKVKRPHDETEETEGHEDMGMGLGYKGKGHDCGDGRELAGMAQLLVLSFAGFRDLS